MEKRLFEVLDIMNQKDAEENTRTVEVGNTFVSGQKVKQGSYITMGMPEHALHQIMEKKKVPILILVDMEEYNKHKKA